MALRLRRGTNTQRTDITPEEGELIYVTDYGVAGVSPLWVGDGVTEGGNEVGGGSGGGGITDIVNDTTPQLGGELDINGNDITGTGDIRITGDITAISGTMNANSFVGNLTGNVTGNLTGDVTGSVVGNVTGNLTGNVVGNLDGTTVSATTVTASTLNGNLTGNVTGNLTGAITATGVLDGDFIGSVFGDDSSLLVDGILGQVKGDFIDGAVNVPSTGLQFTDSTTSPYATFQVIHANNRRSQLELVRKNFGGSIASGDVLGSIQVVADDSGGYTRVWKQTIYRNGMFMFHDENGAENNDDIFAFRNGQLGLGVPTPTAKLDVNGSGKFAGDVEASAFKGTFVADDSTVLVDGVAGNVSLANNNLADLGNVSTTAPTVNQVLKWTGTQWAPSADQSASGSLTASISGATQANPVVITTSADHGFTNGASVTITDVVGMTELNGNDYYVDVQTSTTFGLYSDAGLTSPVNGSAFTAYTSGGNATQAAGTDATTLAGLASSYYLDYTNFTNTPSVSSFAETLLDDTTAAAARTTLGLGTAAESATGDFATAAQGTLADSAVQPADLGTFEFAGSVMTTSDSSSITIGQAVTLASDVTVEGRLSGDGSGLTGIEGLSSRGEISGSTGNISDANSADVDITGYKGYMLYKIQTDAAAWVRIYVSDAARTADASRTEGQDPAPDAGVIAEVITTGAETVIIAPGVIGFNNESVVTNNVPLAVTNKSGGVANITVTLTAVEMEV